VVLLTLLHVSVGAVCFAPASFLSFCLKKNYLFRYERIKFLVIALRNNIEVYAWAPKPYHKFMAFKSFSDLPHRPMIVDLTVEEGSRLKVNVLLVVKCIFCSRANTVAKLVSSYIRSSWRRARPSAVHLWSVA